jgi:hypothetical protein
MKHEEAREFLKNHLNHKGKKSVTPTEHLIRWWWRVLNVAVFYSKLHQPSHIEIKGVQGGYGWAMPDTKNKGHVNIRMHKAFISKASFLTVLLHEMVHAWEHQHHTIMGHGKRFYAWRSRIKRTVGLELDESHDENEF